MTVDRRTVLLHFDDERDAALRLADATGWPALEIERHRFPDAELRLRLPVDAQGVLPDCVVIYRGLHHPNEKLIELILSARQARALGARAVVLVSPYLAYMRQDMAFRPGEVVSQRVIGGLLGDLFDGVLTVDPHLHRITALSEAIPATFAIAVSGASSLVETIARMHPAPFLIGPDSESAQWVAAAAALHGWDHAVCNKVRHGDENVSIELPPGLAPRLADRCVVLLDDVASSGQTLVVAARLARAAGARSIDVAVTHALLAPDALARLSAAGIGQVWSTDSIPGPTNAVALAPTLAGPLLKAVATLHVPPQ